MIPILSPQEVCINNIKDKHKIALFSKEESSDMMTVNVINF